MYDVDGFFIIMDIRREQARVVLPFSSDTLRYTLRSWAEKAHNEKSEQGNFSVCSSRCQRHFPIFLIIELGSFGLVLDLSHCNYQFAGVSASSDYRLEQSHQSLITSSQIATTNWCRRAITRPHATGLSGPWPAALLSPTIMKMINPQTHVISLTNHSGGKGNAKVFVPFLCLSLSWVFNGSIISLLPLDIASEIGNVII
jgi:hypothetical protein